MKRLRYYFMCLIALFFPWLALLLNDNPGGAFMALIMVVTVIGWIPASIWALRVVRASFYPTPKPQPAAE
ncbi:hypothetical protein Lgee_1993 [Legionella geestiana]|uniref:Uncharacterized protein n=1 Tax=Legionella geestiana TaxID=45065 RepID=A0A0W0TP26_9GAMM|nr:YqaE/Pmp3 family membrane protein [Legionella geestiana]KTC97332.1 hypothetical protein Lgee_1993 [Legionella geestiana]QBS12457.1 YqaE/Pmp3 family membrane protein [Legionella geestiana]QDQ39828.1 YqaE/Pmp3 family membrane protein [Legionella geestiana]STX55100.1 Uncharacterised protein [Legionella geestiana]